MKSRPYYEQIDIENTTKLRELTAALPPFVNDFFRGIEQTTSCLLYTSYILLLWILTRWAIIPPAMWISR